MILWNNRYNKIYDEMFCEINHEIYEENDHGQAMHTKSVETAWLSNNLVEYKRRL